jgi:hypothetical protein
MLGLLGIEPVYISAGEMHMLMVMKDVPIISVDLDIIANAHCRTIDANQTLSTIKFLPLLGGFCHTADFGQMWHIKIYAPHWRTCHTADIDQMWPKNMPLVGGLCHTADFDQMWSKNVPLIGVLCHTADFDQMWSKNVPLIGGLCHTVDFDQMWSKNVPLIGRLCHTADFNQMWPRHKPLIGGLCHTADICPTMAQNIHSS